MLVAKNIIFRPINRTSNRDEKARCDFLEISTFQSDKKKFRFASFHSSLIPNCLFLSEPFWPDVYSNSGLGLKKNRVRSFFFFFPAQRAFFISLGIANPTIYWLQCSLNLWNPPYGALLATTLFTSESGCVSAYIAFLQSFDCIGCWTLSFLKISRLSWEDFQFPLNCGRRSAQAWYT